MYNGEKLNPKQFVATAIEEIKAQVGNDTVVLGLSGGVDSTVTALLISKAIGDNLVCIFVDHGLLRKNEFEDVLESYKGMGLNVIGVRAADRFFAACKGIVDPELKRKAIGKTFIDIFAEEARKVQDAKWLAQGTIWPDIAESHSDKGTLEETVYQLIGGLRSGMGYCGAHNLAELQTAKFTKVTASGMTESHPHDVTITKETPNYTRGE